MKGKRSISYHGEPKSKHSTNRAFDFLSEKEKRRLCLNRINLLKSWKPQISVLEDLLFHIVKLVFRVRANNY